MADNTRVIGKVNEPKQKKLEDMTPEERIQAMLPYNLNNPHKRIITNDGHLIVQDGKVYKYGSGECLGDTSVLIPASNVIICKKCGATFPKTPIGQMKLEQHKDLLQHADAHVKEGEEVEKTGLPEDKRDKKDKSKR